MAWKGQSKGKAYAMPEIRGPLENRVFVGNLSWEATWQDLKDHMRQVGEVAFADVMLEEDGRSRGCGLVAYRSAADAQRAVLELHDSELMGRKILVREERRAAGKGRASQECRVYVGNLAWNVTWKELKDHMRQVGEVARADVICEGGFEGGRSKGYGIVEFRTPEEAQAAVEQLTDTTLEGRTIFVREDRESFRPVQQPAATQPWAGGYVQATYKGSWDGSSASSGSKVFVGNLPFEVSWQDLKDHMRSVGDVVHAEIMTEGGEPGGRSKGSAVVEFATFGAARRAVAQLHDSILGGRMILVREYYPPYEGSSASNKGGKAGRGKGKLSAGVLPESTSACASAMWPPRLRGRS